VDGIFVTGVKPNNRWSNQPTIADNTVWAPSFPSQGVTNALTVQWTSNYLIRSNQLTATSVGIYFLNMKPAKPDVLIPVNTILQTALPTMER
jgi:hypothetical protein